jgi:site-specific recombinase XerC
MRPARARDWIMDTSLGGNGPLAERERRHNSCYPVGRDLGAGARSAIGGGRAIHERHYSARRMAVGFLIHGRLGPISVGAVQYMMRRAGEAAGLPNRVHPRMLRHGCGYYLTNSGANTRLVQELLGHVDIRHTMEYTEVDAVRFRDLWGRSR